MKAAAEHQSQRFESSEKRPGRYLTGESFDLGNIVTFNHTENRNDIAEKKKQPSLFKLHLELVQDEDGTTLRLSAGEEALLNKYARMKTGISRDIIVPADMTLHKTQIFDIMNISG